MKFKKIALSLLAIVMVVVTCIPSYAHINDNDVYNPRLTSLFYKADDNEIVAYYDGQPIQKKI